MMRRPAIALLLLALGSSPAAAEDTTPTPASPEATAPATGQVQFTAENGQQLEVWIDGRRVGLTPLRGRIPAGERFITTSAEGVVPAFIRLTVSAADEQRVDIRVEPLTESALQILTARLQVEIEANPRNPHLYLIRALTATDPATVLESVAEAERLAPGTATAAIVKANWMLRDRKGNEAAQSLEAALSREPRNAALHRTRAKALAVAARDPEALQAADEALRLDPRDWQNHYVRGIVRRQNGDIAGAREDLEAALRLSPNNDMVIRSLEGLQPAARP